LDRQTSEGSARNPAGLAARIRAGDRRAEEELVERYGRGLKILLERHTNGRPEAEDLLQEALSLGIQKVRRGELREGEKLPAFLSRLARNLAIDFYRKAQRRKTEPDGDVVAAATIASAVQVDRLLRQEHAALVRRVIEELRNGRDREVIFRFYIAEEDKEQISVDFDLTGQQFNRVLHRARERYKELYLQLTAAREGALHRGGSAGPPPGDRAAGAISCVGYAILELLTSLT
jgi:RNA polymerase sigma-70 factor, ECF subfamily